ncbi:MAG TPA: MarR family transcriptional regulator [Edaphobacter sp.]
MERTEELAVSELAESIVLLVRRVRAATIDDHDLSLAERSLLGRLNRDGASTTADLARLEHMKPQSMGAIVAGLVEKGLVKRKPHPTDGRQFLIDLTAKGAAVRRSIRAAKESWIAQAVAELSPAEKKTLFAAGEIMRRMVSGAQG